MSEPVLRAVVQALVTGQITRQAADEILRGRATPKQLRQIARMLALAYTRKPFRCR